MTFINGAEVKSDVLKGNISYIDPYDSYSTLEASFFYNPPERNDFVFREIEKIILNHIHPSLFTNLCLPKKHRIWKNTKVKFEF